MYIYFRIYSRKYSHHHLISKQKHFFFSYCFFFIPFHYESLTYAVFFVQFFAAPPSNHLTATCNHRISTANTYTHTLTNTHTPTICNCFICCEHKIQTMNCVTQIMNARTHRALARTSVRWAYVDCIDINSSVVAHAARPLCWASA